MYIIISITSTLTFFGVLSPVPWKKIVFCQGKHGETEPGAENPLPSATPPGRCVEDLELPGRKKNNHGHIPRVGYHVGSMLRIMWGKCTTPNISIRKITLQIPEFQET